MRTDQVAHNIAAHDSVAKVYDLKHAEIYNEIEQVRLSSLIKDIVGLSGKRPHVLDYGCGTGNLTLKFLDQGCTVTALDISEKSLSQLQGKAKAGPNLITVLFDGKALPFKDASYDLVATYSVLHHIPDYITALSDMIRVLRPGGLIYIDHEFNGNHWSPGKGLKEYYSLASSDRFEHIKRLLHTGELFTYDFIKAAFIKAFVNKRYQREGDLHVWPDDHIGWDRIKDSLSANKLHIVREKDYLLFRPKAGLDAFRKYSKTCSDTKYLIARK